MTYNSSRTEQRSTWWLQGSGTNIASSQNYETRLSQRLPIGGTFSVAMSNYSTDTNQLYQLFNPYYNTQLRFSFVQPLLKNFGPRVAKREIIVARQNYAISEAQLKNQVMETIYQVEKLTGTWCWPGKISKSSNSPCNWPGTSWPRPEKK